MNKKKKSNQSNGSKRYRRVIKLTLQFLMLIFLLTLIIGIVYFYLTYGKTILQLQSQASQMVNSSTKDTFKASQTSLVYDSQGNLISTLKAEKDVYYLEYDEIPSIVMKAMMITEDRKFMEHNGVDYWANIRAVLALIRHKGEITQGASTITQQLARNVFLTQEVTYERKVAEIFAAQELEKKYSKSEIMEFYLNEIYFANGHYGLQAAAQSYFGTGIANLSLSQTMFLCAIPNNPNLYNPLTKMENTLKRRNRILLQLLQNDIITQSEYDSAVSEKIELKQEKADKKNYVETYTFYCAIRALMKQQGFQFRNQFDSEEDQKAYEAAYNELYNQFQKDLYRKGYRIYTSFDLPKQELLQKSVDHVLEGYQDVNNDGIFQMQGAAVCIDNDSGRVAAIVGGREQDLKGYTLNRGYQSYRQPGSAIKPLIVYTPAFERGYLPDRIVTDRYEKGGPKNSDGNYLGKMQLKRAVELSKNTVAWKLFEELTPKTGLSYLINMNFAKISSSDYVPAASLGGLTVGTSPVEMAAAYAALENDGEYREPTCIVKITDAEGNEIVGETVETKPIYKSNASRIMTEVLTGVIKNGTAKGLGLTNTVSAGKTGTTNDKKDGWFVGYTPYYTTSVWVGYDMPKTVSNLKGSTYPGVIWHDFMEQIHDASMKREFEFFDWRGSVKKTQETKDAEEEIQETEEQLSEEESVNDNEMTETDMIEDDSTQAETEDNAESDFEEEYPEEEYNEDPSEEESGDELDEGEASEENMDEGTDLDGNTEENTTQEGSTPENNTQENNTQENNIPEDNTQEN